MSGKRVVAIANWGSLTALVGATLFVLLATPPAAAQQGDLNALLNQVRELRSARNYSAALIEAQKLEAVVKAKFGKNHPHYAVALYNLGLVYDNQEKYPQAEELYKRALAISEKARGTNHPEVATILHGLALAYEHQGRYSEAESNGKRALAIKEKVFGANHPEVTKTLNNLGETCRLQGKYTEAEEIHKRALAIGEKAFGVGHHEVAPSLNNLALVYGDQGKYANAEELLKRAIIIDEKTFGVDHPSVGATLNNLANVYRQQGKYSEAQRLYQRALTIREKALGVNHPLVAQTLNNLANVYDNEGKYAEAEAVYKRALALREKVLGASHPDVADSLNGLGNVYVRQAKYVDAEDFYRRALTIKENALGPDHPKVAKFLENLAIAYTHQARHAHAEGLLKRVLAIREKAFGSNHPDLARTLSALGAGQTNNADAEWYFKRALAIREKTLGSSHPDTAETLNNLAIQYAAAGKIESALTYSRKASAAVITHGATEIAGVHTPEQLGGLIERRTDYFMRHLANLDDAARIGTVPASTFGPEALQIAQWANQSSTAAALQQMALRFASRDGPIADLVRKRQDLSTVLRERDKALIGLLSKPAGQRDAGLIDAVRREIAEADGNLAATADQLEKQFPEYAALATPRPLNSEELQQMLGMEEALVFWLPGKKETYVFALTREGFEWKTIPLKGEDLANKVAAFRRGLDVDALHRGLVRADCTQAESDKRGLSRAECGRVVARECEEARMRGLAREDCKPAEGPRELFDLGLAHELYST